MKMEYPHRKRLRLEQYDYSQPGAYFITVCVQDKELILGTVVDNGVFLEPSVRLSEIGLVVEKYTRTVPGIDKYVIMPNHVHMILRISAKDPKEGPVWESAPTDTSVDRLIRSWKILISKEIGRSLWQRSYYDHIIRNEKSYVEISRYIENNPAKWGEDQYYPGF